MGGVGGFCANGIGAGRACIRCIACSFSRCNAEATAAIRTAATAAIDDTQCPIACATATTGSSTAATTRKCAASATGIGSSAARRAAAAAASPHSITASSPPDECSARAAT
jgi:hypothetical protein